MRLGCKNVFTSVRNIEYIEQSHGSITFEQNYLNRVSFSQNDSVYTWQHSCKISINGHYLKTNNDWTLQVLKAGGMTGFI